MTHISPGDYASLRQKGDYPINLGGPGLIRQVFKGEGTAADAHLVEWKNNHDSNYLCREPCGSGLGAPSGSKSSL